MSGICFAKNSGSKRKCAIKEALNTETLTCTYIYKLLK